MSAGGVWRPAHAISYGVAIGSFHPLEHIKQPVGANGDAGANGEAEEEPQELNPHQVPLEVGDEVYVFEVFRPTSRPDSSNSGVWYRGYVVSTSPQPRLPFTSSDIYSLSATPASVPLSDEPQVSVGIFPSSHVQIKTPVEDAEQRLSDLPALTARRMEPLQEEDEVEEQPSITADLVGVYTNGTVGPTGTPSKHRSRNSVGSLKSFKNALSGDQQVLFQSSRSSQYGQIPPGLDGRPSAPLPNLKCGDETSSGAEEPLIDEIACALREWATLLYTHLYRRDYDVFNSVRAHIDALHSGRRQLLGKTLSMDETERLRRDMVARLVKGNVEQGLDVIVRHPTWGGLVDVEVEGEIERKGWVSVVRMYAMQVSLAYSSSPSDNKLTAIAPPPVLTSISPTDGLTPSPSNPRLSIPNFAAIAPAPAPIDPTKPTPPPLTGAKFYHVYVNLRAFVANPCAPGETAELYFSLFNKTDARYLTEEYCVILNDHGVPAREPEGEHGRMTTLFRDLSQHDIQDQIFLVCRIIKNGSIKLAASSSSSNGNGPSAPVSAPSSPHHLAAPPRSTRPDSASFDSSISHTGVDFGLGTSSGMLTSSLGGRQSYRRPFGCAVLDLSQFNKTAQPDPDEEATTAAQEHHMSIFVPANEASFATIHEDIIASRIREIERSPRAEHVAVNVRVLYGEARELVREHPSLLTDVPLTQRLGFPDVTFPGDMRNEVYLKLWSGDFSSGGAPKAGRGLASLAVGAGAKNIEVTAEVRMRDGAMVDRVISRGSGESPVTQYNSIVFRGNNTPTWGELVKLEIPIEIMEQCHIFFTFRSRGSKGGTVSGGAEKPFAFAYFPLFLENAAFVPDGSHSLVLYRYERNCATSQFYFQAPSTVQAGHSPILPPSIVKTLVPIKDTMTVRSFLVSTHYTQNETLLRLLRWETTLLHDQEALKDVLTKLRFCSEVEVCKFLRDIFDALFGILISVQNQSSELDDLVFQALVTILGIVSDRRFTNFKPVLDVYIEHHFNCATASTHFIKSLDRLLRNPSSADAGTILRSSIKVWHYVFKFIVRSREIMRDKDVAGGMGVTSDHLETTFKRELRQLLAQVNSLMGLLSPSSIIGTQTLAVQHFASIIPDLAKCFDEQDLADIAVKFGDSVAAPKGKMAVWKLLFQNQLVHSVVFESPTGRAALVPVIGRWLKASLGKFDENLFGPKDSQATRDNARVSWIEGIRLATGTIAAMLDRIQEALVSPEIRKSRSLLGQEQDNIEYLLNLLPRLLDSYRELENPANLESVERQRSQASVVSDVPVVFPSSYPFSLLSRTPASTRQEQADASSSRMPTPLVDERPSLQSGVGEIACVFIALLLLAPRKIFVGWLEAQLEIEGKDNFARHLTQMFRVARSILENDAYPEDWLNINILAHRVIVKMVDPVSELLEREFIPSQQESFTFNTGLWRDFFGMLLRLLASPQLLIEEFSPQKRRAVWRLAGDIRGEGAKVLIRLWNAIGWPEERATEPSALKGRHGGYQVQFVPGLVEDVLSLCLSHHDELRTVAVHVLYSMIVSEYYLNDDFTVIEAEVIDRLDKLFMNQTKGDEISRAFFVGQLRALFDEANIADRLREQVDTFLSSVNSFLDLLLAVRNLPEGEEYQEDRIISTLKLMSFIRGIGRSEIFVRYVNRLVTYHVALGNETEAGLTLKLHADLHSWNLHAYLEPIPELELPRQTEFARKETLYMRILAHLSKGKAWETALAICKELQQEYETTSFNYSRLSELLVLQSELYASIAKSDRHFGEFFRVAFYGTRFPLSVSGKQFIYRGNEWEKLGAFVEKMLNKHPGAQLLKTSTIPPEEIYSADAQLIQITGVTCEADVESPIFTNPDVPQAVKAYYLHNGTNTFSFTRPVHKDPSGRVRVANDFTSLWTEKTVLICEDAFPTVLRRSEVVEIRIIDISPVENALNDVDGKRNELDTLERRYHAISQTEVDRSKINTNILSMALNGAVDAPVNQGIPMYRKCFFGSDFMAANPEKAPLVARLQDAIDALVLTISRCMKLHAALAPDAMQPFHDTLETFFEKNFAEELSRLPVEPYDTDFPFTPSPSLPSAPLSSVANPGRALPRQGSISITTNPSLRHSTADLAYARRDSTATNRSSVATVTPSSVGNGDAQSTLGRKDSLSSPKFHIPPISSLSTSPQRTPSFYAAGGRSLDALSETGIDGKSGSDGLGSSMRNGNGHGGEGSNKLVRGGGALSERKGSVLGSLRWKTKKGGSPSLAEE